MAKAKGVEQVETDAEEVILRVYEVGYHIVPSIKEDDVESVVGEIRTVIEKVHGTFIAEGAPILTKLAYEITKQGAARGKKEFFDRGYFGWIKFESSVAALQMLDETLKANTNILRFLITQTVREDTRARIKIAPMREVRRTDTLRPALRREETSAPVSEVDLDKAIKDLTVE